MYYYDYTMPIGHMRLVEEGGYLVAFNLAYKLPADGMEQQETPVLRQAFQELEEYFNHQRTAFSVPLRPKGTTFQRQVWQALVGIPYGTTQAYSDLAESIQNPNAVRAVGNANGKNPILILIPCHRVIGKNGSLTGFAAGLDMKRQLLTLEQDL